MSRINDEPKFAKTNIAEFTFIFLLIPALVTSGFSLEATPGRLKATAILVADFSPLKITAYPDALRYHSSLAIFVDCHSVLRCHNHLDSFDGTPFLFNYSFAFAVYI